MRILYIEDDISLQSAMTLMMHIQGHDVFIAEDGDNALALATADNDIDMIICDGELYSERGPDIIRDIQENNVILPTLFYTANQQMLSLADEFVKSGLIQGPVAYLLKPRGNEEIFEAIESIVPGFRLDSVTETAREAAPKPHRA